MRLIQSHAMNTFADNIHLKERAEEDLYFARKDRELFEALRKKKLAPDAKSYRPGDQQQTVLLEEALGQTAKKPSS